MSCNQYLTLLLVFKCDKLHSSGRDVQLWHIFQKSFVVLIINCTPFSLLTNIFFLFSRRSRKNMFFSKSTNLHIPHRHLLHENSHVHSFHYERNPKCLIRHLCSSPHQARCDQFLLHCTPQILLLWLDGTLADGKRHDHHEYPKNHHRPYPSQTQGHKSRLFHRYRCLNHSV